MTDNHLEKPNYIPSYAVELSLYTGMRVGELSGLKWEDIDTEHGIMVIRHSEKYDRKTNEHYVSLPKMERYVNFLYHQKLKMFNPCKKVELKRVGCLNLYFLMLMVVFMHV